MSLEDLLVHPWIVQHTSDVEEDEEDEEVSAIEQEIAELCVEHDAKAAAGEALAKADPADVQQTCQPGTPTQPTAPAPLFTPLKAGPAPPSNPNNTGSEPASAPSEAPADQRLADTIGMRKMSLGQPAVTENILYINVADKMHDKMSSSSISSTSASIVMTGSGTRILRGV